jgi:hypothetical protein
MRIENAVHRMHSILDGWIRVERVTNLRRGLEIRFGVHSGQVGKIVEAWLVQCSGVLEVKLTDFDGGGLAVYSSDHPAARQYTAPQVELRWSRGNEPATVLAVLHDAHLVATDDWIPFERYVLPNIPYVRGFRSRSRREFSCHGPDFLMNAYAKALRASGGEARLVPGPNRLRRGTRPKVLHFGRSYVVANVFAAERDSPI